MSIRHGRMPRIPSKRYSIPCLGDPAGKLAREFGVLDEEAGQAFRGTFILNPEGKIKAYEIHDMGIGRNAQELLRKVQAARFVEEHGDQVCPAKWKPGRRDADTQPGFGGNAVGRWMLRLI